MYPVASVVATVSLLAGAFGFNRLVDKYLEWMEEKRTGARRIRK